jgi:hypothetical protein
MEKIYKAIELARSKGLPQENYWLYFKKDGSKVEAHKDEKKRGAWVGFFVEDDSRITTIAKIAERKTKWRKE